MNMRKLVVIIYSLVLLFAGCDDLEDKPYTTGEANGVVEVKCTPKVRHKTFGVHYV